MARGNGGAYRLCPQSFNLANFYTAIYSFKIFVSICNNTDMLYTIQDTLLAICNIKKYFSKHTLNYLSIYCIIFMLLKSTVRGIKH